MTEKKKWTSTEIATAVRRHYGAEKDGYGPQYAALDEFSLYPGGGGGRADLFLIRAWSGKPKGHERITVEIKVSRSDFLREKAQPHKMAPFQDVSHRVYFATPEGIIKDTDDLGDVGHLLVTASGVRVARRGVRNDNPSPLGERALVEAFRRASRAEARERSAGDDPQSQVLTLKRELAQINRREINLSNRYNRDSVALSNWAHLVSKVGGVPCLCGAMMKKQSRADLRSASFYRASHEDDSACPLGYPQVDMTALVEMALGVTSTDEGA